MRMVPKWCHGTAYRYGRMAAGRCVLWLVHTSGAARARHEGTIESLACKFIDHGGVGCSVVHTRGHPLVHTKGQQWQNLSCQETAYFCSVCRPGATCKPTQLEIYPSMLLLSEL